MTQFLAAGMSFLGSEIALPTAERLGDAEGDVSSLYSSTVKGECWQDPQPEAWDPSAIWAPVNVTVETINLQLTTEPSWALSFLVLFCSAWHPRFLYRNLCPGKKMLHELCPHKVTIWLIFILLNEIPWISFSTDAAGPAHSTQVTAAINQHAIKCN